MAARDVLFGGALLFILAIGFFVMTFTSNAITSSLTQSKLNESEQAVAAMEAANNAVSHVDYIFLGVFIALMLGLVITGWFIGGVPIFMFIYFLVNTVGVILSTIMSNIWQTVTPASVFGTTLSTVPIMNHIMSYLPFYVAVFGTIGMIVMFAKPQSEGMSYV